MLEITRSELILGGQKSGKSKRAEMLAQAWLTERVGNAAYFIATAQAWDDEMRERIVKHQRDRADRVPGMRTVEEPLALAATLSTYSDTNTLLVVDCLTLWLTHLLMPTDSIHPLSDWKSAVTELCQAIDQTRGPLIFVSNEIGWGVIPMGRKVRAFVDALGQLNQAVATHCTRVTLMLAGLPLNVKEEQN